MRTKALAVLLVTVLVIAGMGGVMVAPAAAGRATTPPASITSVVPRYVSTATDDCGTYCEYDALVTLSWTGTVRLWVAQFVDGVRHAPTGVRLTGSGTNVTLLVTGIRAEPGTGPLVAEVFVLAKRTWTLAASRASAPVTCSVTV